jgi:hypothetical protein
MFSVVSGFSICALWFALLWLSAVEFFLVSVSWVTWAFLLWLRLQSKQSPTKYLVPIIFKIIGA